jgi:hypothetical protein
VLHQPWDNSFLLFRYWTLDFLIISPNPLRYKEIMKAPHNYHLTMPVWSEQELLLVDTRIDAWYERFAMLGGISRLVFWDGEGTDPLETLQDVLESHGAIAFISICTVLAMWVRKNCTCCCI